MRTKVIDGLKVRHYGCTRHRDRGAAVCRVAVSRPTDAVEEALADAIRVACERPEVVEVILAAMRAEVDAESVAAASVDTTGHEAELLQVRREQRNLMRLAAKLDDDDAEVIREI